MSRPNRSDVHLSIEEEAKMEEETRDHFHALAPKRHTKPQRSDYSSHYVDDVSIQTNDTIPEQVQFQRLENDSQKLVYSGTEATEEFVETEYYKDLSCVDKQHHTTGTGFIKMDKNGRSFSIAPDSAIDRHASGKCNPATNDWISAPADSVTFASSKPSRSDI